MTGIARNRDKLGFRGDGLHNALLSFPAAKRGNKKFKTFY